MIRRNKSRTNVIDNPILSDYEGQGMITISYDDGLKSFFQLALPLHEKYGIPTTVNIIGNKIMDPKFKDHYMNAIMVGQCEERGVEVASHSYLHNRFLTSKSDEEIEFEFTESKRVLETIVKKVNTISIPFSRYDERVKCMAMKYYDGVRVSGNQYNDIRGYLDYYWLQSFVVHHKSSFEEIQKIIDGTIQCKNWCIIMLHGIQKGIKDSVVFSEDTEEYYDISVHLLEKILKYIASIDRSLLLPINTKEAIKILKEKE